MQPMKTSVRLRKMVFQIDRECS